MSDDMNPRVAPDLTEDILTLSHEMKFGWLQLEAVARARAGRWGESFNDLPRPQKGRGR
jgi:hypothetical protein